jgi:hypothetical protein
MAIIKQDYGQLWGGELAVESLIAPVQKTLIADKTYNVGDQFIYDDRLYKVTVQINATDNIVIGTNAELADDVTTQINERISVPSLTMVNDIISGTQLPSASQWYSVVHTTVNKGKYLVFGHARMTFTATPAGTNPNIYTGLYLNPTINATTKALSGGMEFAENNSAALQYWQVPLIGIVTVPNDNSIIAIGTWSNATENATISSRNLQVIKIG